MEKKDCRLLGQIPSTASEKKLDSYYQEKKKRFAEQLELRSYEIRNIQINP